MLYACCQGDILFKKNTFATFVFVSDSCIIQWKSVKIDSAQITDFI